MALKTTGNLNDTEYTKTVGDKGMKLDWDKMLVPRDCVFSIVEIPNLGPTLVMSVKGLDRSVDIVMKAGMAEAIRDGLGEAIVCLKEEISGKD